MFVIINNETPGKQIAENTRKNTDTILSQPVLKTKLDKKAEILKEKKVEPVIKERRKEKPPVEPLEVQEYEAYTDSKKVEEDEIIPESPKSEEPIAKNEIAGNLGAKTDNRIADTLTEKRIYSYNYEMKEEAAAPAASGANAFRKSTARSAAKSKSVGFVDNSFATDEEPPKFESGDVTDFQKYIQKQIGNISDTSKIIKTTVQFTIDENGRVRNAKIIKGSSEYDSEIIDKVLKSPWWKPAKENGKKVKKQLTINVLVEKK